MVQDELGGSVSCENPPNEVRAIAEDVSEKLKNLLHEKIGPQASLLYGRIDILPGLFLGELELFEPELFFLDRRIHAPNLEALEKFYRGVLRFCDAQ